MPHVGASLDTDRMLLSRISCLRHQMVGSKFVQVQFVASAFSRESHWTPASSFYRVALQPRTNQQGASKHKPMSLSQLARDADTFFS